MELGRALRRARLGRGLTLRQVEKASGGRYKPSSIAGYERGERKITVERFCRLASFYGEEPGPLLTEALTAASRREMGGVVIDLTRLMIVLPDLEEDVRRVLEDRMSGVRNRAGRPTDVVRLGPEELERLALETGKDPEELLAHLRPALGDGASEPHS